MERLPLQNTGGMALLNLSRNCRNAITTFLQANPLLIKELEVLAPNYERNCELGTNCTLYIYHEERVLLANNVSVTLWWP